MKLEQLTFESDSSTIDKLEKQMKKFRDDNIKLSEEIKELEKSAMKYKTPIFSMTKSERAKFRLILQKISDSISKMMVNSKKSLAIDERITQLTAKNESVNKVPPKFVYDKIRKLRKDGLSDEDISEKLKITLTTVNNVE